MKIFYTENKSTEFVIEEHLLECSPFFKPSLSTYVNIKEYTKKIFQKSHRFESFFGDKLIGLIGAYINADSVFITNLSVIKEFQSRGIGKNLLDNCVNFMGRINLYVLQLEVKKENSKALRFYENFGFVKINENEDNFKMEFRIEKRNYDQESIDNETRKYFYNFDSDIMHHYMISSIKPFFYGNNLLELGSFRGDFTEKILPFFEKITCIEASEDAIKIAKNKLGGEIEFHNCLFEEAKIDKKFDNIVLIHVLEHIDEPIKLLKKIKDEWLSDNGKLFIICPNANAPSRQIAVKMGIISHNSAVTDAEREHGHRITYTFDTLERDVNSSRLKVIGRDGIFFKALSNFQWDSLLETNIISKEYLDGCYYLGQQYPNLCSSILLVCTK